MYAEDVEESLESARVKRIETHTGTNPGMASKWNAFDPDQARNHQSSMDSNKSLDSQEPKAENAAKGGIVSSEPLAKAEAKEEQHYGDAAASSGPNEKSSQVPTSALATASATEAGKDSHPAHETGHATTKASKPSHMEADKDEGYHPAKLHPMDEKYAKKIEAETHPEHKPVDTPAAAHHGESGSIASGVSGSTTSDGTPKKKPGFMAKLKGEAKIISGKLGHNEAKIEEGRKIMHGDV